MYLYAYALLNILGTISLKQNKFERAVQTFNQIEEFVSKDDGYAYEIERERSQIEEELHVIFFNRGNAYMVKSLTTTKETLITGLGTE